MEKPRSADHQSVGVADFGPGAWRTAGFKEAGLDHRKGASRWRRGVSHCAAAIAATPCYTQDTMSHAIGLRRGPRRAHRSCFTGLMKIIELNHVALFVADVSRSSHFYGKLLGLPLIERPAFDFPGAGSASGPRKNST